MATTKITDLTAYTDPVNTDVLPIVDVTSDVTKKVSIANVMKNASLGSNTAPGIAFDGDPNTGIYSPGADQVAVTTGGTQRLLIDSAGAVTIAGDLTVNGTTTNINTTNLVIEDKNIILGDVTTPTDVTADGGGITLKGTTDKTINWVDSTDAWTSSERFSYPLGSAAAPTLTFTGDANTGIYSPGADQVAISTNGTGRLFVASDGTIGIGQASDSSNYRLNVYNPSADFCAVSIGNNVSGSGASNGLILIQNQGDSTFLNRENGYMAFWTNNTERMRLTSDGKLGLGTSSPETNLDVAGSSGSVQIRTRRTDSADVRLAADTGLGFTGTANSHPFAIRTNNTAALTIDTSQRVGIGTSSPERPLHVIGTGRFDNGAIDSVYTGTTTGAQLGIFRTYGVGAGVTGEVDLIGRLESGSLSNSYFSINTTFSGVIGERLRVDSSGRVGIGTTSPGQALQIVTAAEPLKLQSTTAGNNYITHAHNSSGNIGLLGAGGGGAISSGASTDYAICAAQGSLLFASNGNNERGRFDTSGRLLVGTSTAQGSYPIQVESAGSGIFIRRNLPNGSLGDGNGLGIIDFGNQSGGVGARIEGVADAGWGAGGNDYPSRLVFSTTADGASSPTERMRIASTGRITIEANSTTGGIYVNNWSTGAGNSTVKYSSTTGQLTYDTSSRLVKTDIEDCPYGLEQIKLLRPRQYFRVDDQRNEIGFVADEVASVMPEFVPVGPKSIITKNEDDTEEIPLAVNYDKITAVLTKALQQALTKIETLEAKVAALEAS
jgi:hypothetical protein